MKKKCTLFIFLFGFLLSAKANHITGGEMFYTLMGTSNSQYTYRVTLKLFKQCNSSRDLDADIVISVFDRVTNSRLNDVTVAMLKRETLNLSNPNPCITNPPVVCYDVGHYQADITLPASANGYLLAAQENFRIAGMANLTSGYSQVGAIYTAEIPGTASVASGPQNNSAHFVGNDLVAICANYNFSYSFAAEDADGDELRYSFCNAYRNNTNSTTGAPDPPPFEPVPYGSGFDGSAPLSSSVQVNSSTGQLTGIAPGEGTYVVTVCVQEVRNGITIATQRKDLQLKIAPCTVAAATLLPAYSLCRDSKTITLSNLSNSSLITSYRWEVSTEQGQPIFTSDAQTLTYTFSDPGSYKIKLVTNPGGTCSDSASTVVNFYPGFKPDFTNTGICFTKPTNFTDATTTTYGTVSSWKWDFGETSATNDVSTTQTASYTYPTKGSKTVRLIAGSSKGCIDTAIKTITITDNPAINLLFRDTLICINDQVQLQAGGSNGQFSWTPTTNITGASTATPVVSPPVTTTYYVRLDDNGCIHNDSVRVRVTDHVTLRAMNDTTICQGDAVTLRVVSDGFKYAWTTTPAAQLSDPATPAPTVVALTATTCEVTASIGSCTAKDQVVITPVPYPVATAGADTIICYNSSARLQGTTDGDSILWSPVSGLSNPRIPDPVARPAQTTSYVLSAYAHKGCPKPGRDTVTVYVLPPIDPVAGRDTSVVTGQPYQFTATGAGVRYQWSPADYLSATDIANPTAAFPEPSYGLKYKVVIRNEAGCADSAYVTIKVFGTPPSVFVPTAFTPNGDGKNELLRPIAVGIVQIEYFRVYNRWGEMVFSTSVNGWGWDGRTAGKVQQTGTYVWMVKAVDYTGKPYFGKGVSTLIR